ncbi:related to hydroxylase [Phialocephala subalpina]|uniref:Related to hydroxylase n=1 Tax=Phialocephala subalpina TaxID=576137 RepID=A0A1L7XTI2_9HELO|nr:related to hydroxylase [Phialocephala subalpina]
MAEKAGGFKVIIVGGSIAGLTLAHCLQRGGIDFLVLEAHNDISPQVGASIGIFPSGARVLDQLGIWDDIEDLIEPLLVSQVWTNEGEPLKKADQSELIRARMGYPLAFLDRQFILKVLFNHVDDKSKILVNKKVLSVDHAAAGVVVNCKDGSQYVGDIVAGADGVHSVIRHEMWRHADSCGPLDLMAKDKTGLSTEYQCLFGISSPVPGLKAGQAHRTYNKDWSFLVILGKEGRCFWFIFEKLKQRYYAPNIPRYSTTDEENFVKPYMKRYLSGNITFDALWERKITCTLVALEEAQYEHWTFDRFACLGDSIHKMTPNMGQGGNSAIESAAALANSLHEINEGNKRAKPSLGKLRNALKRYEQSRQFRAKRICDTANDLTRLEAFATLKHKIIGKYILPRAGDFLADSQCDVMIGATKLDILPVPPRSIQGNMPFDPKAGIGQKESRKWRALYALPLLGLFYYGRYTLTTTLSLTAPFISKALMTGAIATSDGASVAIRSNFYGIGWLDKLVKRFVTVFTPSIGSLDQAQRLQMIGFMADLTPVQIIWSIEGLRRGNMMTLATLPTLFGIAYQLKGIGLVAPLYYFLHYIQTPQEKYLAADNRLVPTVYAKTLIPAITLGYVAPTLGMFLPFSIDTRQAINGIWQLFPVWTSLLHTALKFTVTDTTQKERIHNVRADMTYLRYAYAFGGCLSAAAYLYLWMTSPIPLRSLFFSGISSPSAPVFSLSDGIGRFLKYDQIFSFGSGMFWEVLHFNDLKKAGKLKAGWGKILGVLGGATLVLGPGAAMALGWAWREEVLAAKKIPKA